MLVLEEIFKRLMNSHNMTPELMMITHFHRKILTNKIANRLQRIIQISNHLMRIIHSHHQTQSHPMTQKNIHQMIKYKRLQIHLKVMK